MSTPSLRSDFKLIRHLSKTYDPLVGRFWQDLPLIQVPPSALNLKKQDKNMVRSFSQLPFKDFVFDLDGTGFAVEFSTIEKNFFSSREPKNLVHYWFRLTEAEHYLRRYKQSSPWFEPPWFQAAWKDKEFSPDLFLEVFTNDPYNTMLKDFITPMPEVTAMQFEPFRYHHCFTETEVKMIERSGPEESKNILEEYRNHVMMAAIICEYLKVTTEYMVDVRPENISRPRYEPRKDKKPWTYEYLPRIILLDPHKTHNNNGASPAGGSHASPRPHQRRAHYRKYKSERFTNVRGQVQFIKPAWVGPSEWILNGAVYRVLGL